MQSVPEIFLFATNDVTIPPSSADFHYRIIDDIWSEPDVIRLLRLLTGNDSDEYKARMMKEKNLFGVADRFCQQCGGYCPDECPALYPDGEKKIMQGLQNKIVAMPCHRTLGNVSCNKGQQQYYRISSLCQTHVLSCEETVLITESERVRTCFLGSIFDNLLNFPLVVFSSL